MVVLPRIITLSSPTSHNPNQNIAMRIKCYDNHDTADRYTVVYLASVRGDATYDMRGMSEDPFHPQGFGQMTEGMDGSHLGDEIDFTDLPAPCRIMVRQDLYYLPDEKKRDDVINRIMNNKNPVCLHALGQPLADSLCAIIRELIEHNRDES